MNPKSRIRCFQSRGFVVSNRGFVVSNREESLFPIESICCFQSRGFVVLNEDGSLFPITMIRGSQMKKCVIPTQKHVAKFWNFTRHFLANSANRPGICANHDQIRPNPGTIVRIRQKVACRFSCVFLSKFCQNFERLENREDSSDFDDFLTKSIASPRSNFSKIFAPSKKKSRRRKSLVPSNERTNEILMRRPSMQNQKYKTNGPSDFF